MFCRLSNINQHLALISLDGGGLRLLSTRVAIARNEEKAAIWERRKLMAQKSNVDMNKLGRLAWRYATPVVMIF
jgi:hypothetical protein